MPRFVAALIVSVLFAACTSGSGSSSVGGPGAASTPLIVRRPGFLGAFFRPIGPPPFGVFSVYSKQRAPEPYPAPSTQLFGRTGYCDRVAANGVSISSGYLVDPKKIANIANLNVGWTRTPVSADYDDLSHIFGPGKYLWADFDAGQCALLRAHIVPIVNLEAGSVQYNVDPDVYSPKERPLYKTADDFGAWCGVVARHETQTFTAVNRYSLPGNEVNSHPEMFTGGDPQIAAYSKACYHAIKAVAPHAVVYGFELNMEKDLDAPAFVQRMYDLGCKPGTCYDAISMHLYLPYPIPPPQTPCYPHPGGNYSMQCIADVQSAAHAPALHILIGETGFFVPSSVPDEATKAKASVDALERFAAIKLVDGVNYANVDECDLYPSGYFVGGCLVDSIGNKLPAYGALQSLAKQAY